MVVGEEVEFRAADGLPLAGTIFTPSGCSTIQSRSFAPSAGAGRESARSFPESPRGLIVFAHEFGSGGGSALRYCRGLIEAGFEVFSFDFRGHGASPTEPGYRPRPWLTDREHADLLGAISFITARLKAAGRPTEIGVFGLSRGAGAAISAAAEVPNVRVVIADSAFSSDTTIEYMMRRFATIFAGVRVVARNHPAVVWRVMRWMLFRAYRREFPCRFLSARQAVTRMGCRPILFIHGENDSYIPSWQAQSLYDAARGPKDVWIAPGAKHNQAVDAHPREYARRIVHFVEEHLGRSPASIHRPVHALTTMAELARMKSRQFAAFTKSRASGASTGNAVGVGSRSH